MFENWNILGLSVPMSSENERLQPMHFFSIHHMPTRKTCCCDDSADCVHERLVVLPICSPSYTNLV